MSWLLRFFFWLCPNDGLENAHEHGVPGKGSTILYTRVASVKLHTGTLICL